jgi:peroxiredoxin
VGKPAPDFQLPNLEGQPISLSDFRGKPVLLNFWATWCGPCVFEMPFIQSIFEESSDTGLVILAVNIGEAPPTVRDFIQSGNFSFPVLLDTSQDVALEYNVRGIPTTFLIDKDGIIQVIKVGAFSSMLEIKRSLSKIIP